MELKKNSPFVGVHGDTAKSNVDNNAGNNENDDMSNGNDGNDNNGNGKDVTEISDADFTELKTIITPQLPRCDKCTLRGGCNHHSFNDALLYLKDEIKSYPQNPTKEICYNFVSTGACKSFQKNKHCNFHHPYELVVFPKKLKIAQLRCPACTVPNCTKHIQAKQMRNKERRKMRKKKTKKSNNKNNNIEDSESNVSDEAQKSELFNKKPKRKSGFMRMDEKVQRVKYEDVRCLICTLKLPCKHFADKDDMKELFDKEKQERRRYPNDGNTSEKCLYFMFTGNCPSYDQHGVCIYWHPPAYANHTIRLPNEIEKEDSELLGYGHGYSGLPGRHRSTGSYGNKKYNPNALKTARLMLKQDEENLKEIRRRLEWGYGRTFKGGIRKFKRWHLQHPPISRTPLLDPNQKKSWKEKLG